MDTKRTRTIGECVTILKVLIPEGYKPHTARIEVVPLGDGSNRGKVTLITKDGDGVVWQSPSMISGCEFRRE